MNELEIAQQMVQQTQPSWVKDGSADAPSGPPQFGPPPQRAAKLEIPMPSNAQITGGGGGDGSSLPLSTYIVLRGNGVVLAYADIPSIEGEEIP